MTLRKNSAEGGTNGTAPTTGNTGGASGDAFDTITFGSQALFSNATAFHGAMSYHIADTAASQSPMFRYQGYSATQAAYRFYVRFNSAPTATVQIWTCRPTTGTACSVNYTSIGTVQLVNSAGSNRNSFTPTVGVWYRIEVQLAIGASTTTGNLNWQVYVGDSLTTVTTYASTTDNTSTGANISYFDLGKVTASPTGFSIDLDDIAVNDGTLTPIGPEAPTGTTALAATATITASGSLGGNTGTATLAATATIAAAGTLIDSTKVMILGDSLTYESGNGVTDITTAFVAAGYTSGQLYIDGLASRAIWDGHGATPYSSTAINTMRATGFEPKTYVVALGTNNTGFLVSDIMPDYRALMAKIGPGRVVHFIGLGYQVQSECQVQYNPAAGLGARWSELNTVAGRPNAAILNIVEQGTNPATEPTVYYHDWNDYGPLRAAGSSAWDATDTSSPGGFSRHMVRTGYQTYRNPFYAGASLGVIYGDAVATTVASITAAGLVAPVGQASVTTTATMSAAGVVAISKTATLTATATTAAAGFIAESSGATVTATATITATGTVAVIGTGQAAVTATATSTAAGLVAGTRAAALTVTATTAAAGVVTAAGLGTATLTATVTSSAAGYVTGSQPRDINVTVQAGPRRWVTTSGSR